MEVCRTCGGHVQVSIWLVRGQFYCSETCARKAYTS